MTHCRTKELQVLILLGLLGCGITGSDQDHVPAVGRYDYQLTFDGTTSRADLVIEEATPALVRYRFYETQNPGSSNQRTTTYTGTDWSFVVFFPSRSATSIMVRDGNNYSCAAPLVVQNVGPDGPGTCTFTYEGPDSIRQSPRP